MPKLHGLQNGKLIIAALWTEIPVSGRIYPIACSRLQIGYFAVFLSKHCLSWFGVQLRSGKAQTQTHMAQLLSLTKKWLGLTQVMAWLITFTQEDPSRIKIPRGAPYIMVYKDGYDIH